jgi:glycerol-3-phosphate dehydrogenase
MTIRQKNWQLAENKEFDTIIFGGGINGATVYNKLCSQGYKVLLLDKGDFSCGTSQASAMMIWGGLLYLKNLDFLSVYHFSRDRDNLIQSHGEDVDPAYFRYIPNCEWGRNKYLVYLALHLYWILGNFRRKKPSYQKSFAELNLLFQKKSPGSLLYQEGFLKYSDSRFVLDWILSRQTEDYFALNYCAINEAEYSAKDKQWSIDIADTMTKSQCSIKAKTILNCSGVWADSVNRQFGIRSPFRHVFSKGVFISFKRPETHHTPLIFEMGEHGDTLSFIPWGPISMWGPTETMEGSIEEGFSITPEDVHFLRHHAAKNLESSLADAKIISLRCGIRPLVVEKKFKADCYPLDISRHHKIIQDPALPWLSVYGGKISGCISMADEVAQKVAKQVRPSLPDIQDKGIKLKEKTPDSFPGLREIFPSIDWCVENEFCCSLEDYLRRRTNISQWVPREGLGFRDENKKHLGDLAQRLPDFDGKTADSHLDEYVTKVNERFDKLMERI